MRISVVGTRPHWIKASVLGYPILETGQHYDSELSEGINHELLVLGSLNLHTSNTWEMANAIEEWLGDSDLIDDQSEIVVIGDCNSTVAGALAAKNIGLHVIHLEAGARCGENTREELNRKLVDAVSENWAVSARCMENLSSEGLNATYVGDPLLTSLQQNLKNAVPVNGVPPVFSLLTLHRAENVDDPVRLGALLDRVDLPAVWPRHPRVKDFKTRPNLYEIPPVSYLEMLWLLQNCAHVFTDSGGLQREAIWLRKPLTVLRECSEWSTDDTWKPYGNPDCAVG